MLIFKKSVILLLLLLHVVIDFGTVSCPKKLSIMSHLKLREISKKSSRRNSLAF